MATSPAQLDPIDSLAYGRVGIGVALIAAPSLAGRSYLGRESSRPVVRFLLRVFGIRDLALGALTLATKDDKVMLRRLLVAGIACDAVDALAALGAGDGLPRWGRRLVLLAGSSAVAGGALALSQLED
jgi:hypothetical protein